MCSRCNTSVESVVEHVDCSIPLNSTATSLAVFTDETDSEYLSSLLTALNALPRWAGRAVHGDPIAAALSPAVNSTTVDNYFSYAVANAVQNQACDALDISFHDCSPNGTMPCGAQTRWLDRQKEKQNAVYGLPPR